MSTFMQDIRYALRTLRRGWVVTSVAIVSLSFAVGGNTAVFSLVESFLLRPLPYDRPERLVLVGERQKSVPANQGLFSTSLATYGDLTERVRTMETWGAMQPRPMSLRRSERSEAVSGVAATPSLFGVLGVSAERGRTFLPEEGVEGARRVALVSHDFWVRWYGEGDDPIGDVLTLDGEPHEVVGMLPPGFQFLTAGQDVWVPIRDTPTSTPRDRRTLFAVGRMRPDATMEQVRAELGGVASQLEVEYPETQREWTFDAYNMRYDIPTTQTRVLFAMLQGSVLLVLVIACVNITNLLLARGQGRSREIALRTAMGAGRMRIVRQLLTESSIMVAAAAVIGLGLGALGIRLMANKWANLLPAQYELALNGRVLAFTLAVCVVAGLLFGLVPAVETFRSGQVDALKEGGGRGGSRRSRKALSRVLVVAEIALSFVALGGGSLLVRSFLQLRDADAGFDTSRVAVARIQVPDSKFPGDEERLILQDRILDAAGAVPGVRAVALTSVPPQSFQIPTDSFRVAGEAIDPAVPAPLAMRIVASADYLDALGAELVQGRFFDERDRAGSTPVAVVNRTLATARFPGRSALGERLTMRDDVYEIVGVARNVTHALFAAATSTEEVVYLSAAQEPDGVPWILARADADPAGLAEPLRAALQELDPDLTVSQNMTLDEQIAQSFVGVDIFNAVLGGFGVMALLLAALGTYGVLAYAVSQRAQEIGIRMAVGARGAEVVRMIARQGIVLGVIGLALGVALTVPLVGVMNQVLQGLSTVEPMTLVSIAGLLLAVTVVASVLPATRAAAVDPVRTLREE